MIEQVLLDYLTEKLGVPVSMEEPDLEDIPASYVVIERTGGGKSNHINAATFAIQSYAQSLYSAAALNTLVESAMIGGDTEDSEGITELDTVSSCTLNNSYNYTDTAKKLYRYQAVYDIKF